MSESHEALKHLGEEVEACYAEAKIVAPAKSQASPGILQMMLVLEMRELRCSIKELCNVLRAKVQ